MRPGPKRVGFLLMAVYTYSDITGSVVLNTVRATSIGKWNETEINGDKTTNGEYGSTVGDCIRDFESWAALSGVDTSALTSIQETHYNTALIYYIASRYQELSNTAAGTECAEKEVNQLSAYQSASCKFLGNLSIKMQNRVGFCGVAEIDDGMFQVRNYNPQCETWQKTE